MCIYIFHLFIYLFDLYLILLPHNSPKMEIQIKITIYVVYICANNTKS